MKHNVNYVLLGIIIVILVSWVGLIGYGYVTFQGLRTQYNVALAELENTSREVNRTHNELMVKESLLAEKEKILLDYLGELNISKQRETSISEHFLNEKEKAEQLETNLESASTDRDRYQSLYNKYFDESQLYQTKYTESKTNLDSAQNKIGRAKGDATEINNILEDVEAELSAITSELAKIKTKADSIQDKTTNSTIDGLAYDIERDAGTAQTGVAAFNGYVVRMKSLVESIRGS